MVWLENLGVSHLAGDVPDAAKALLEKKGIEVVAISPDQTPEQVVMAYVK